MSKSISIFLLTLTLLGSMMDMHNLAKLPRLMEHYQEHRSKSSDFSFLEFLSLHYGSKSENHDKEEHAQHTGLPFKSSDCTFTHTVTLLPQFQSAQATVPVSTLTYSNFYQSAFSTEFSQSIWQPPKHS
jgi:hypothetical protein